MTNIENIERQLALSVARRDPDLLRGIFQSQEAAVVDNRALLQALTAGLDEAREQLGASALTIAEFLLSVDVLREGLEELKVRGARQDPKDKVVIGVIRGDVHDLGMNIVAGVLEACGYEVLNLGHQVDPERFLEELRSSGAGVLALSTMMSTTLSDLKATIERCRRELPHVRVLVGGAPLDESLATAIGADGYAESAVYIPEIMRRIEQSVARQKMQPHRYVDYDKKVQVIESDQPNSAGTRSQKRS